MYKNNIFEPIKDDTTLNNLISILIDKPSSSLVVDAIEKVKNYNLLTSKDGLQGKKYTWFWENSKLSMKANNKRGNKKDIKKKFLKNNRKVIDDFLKIDNPIPNSTYLEIQNYLDSILDSTDQNNKTEDKDNNKKEKIKTIIGRIKTIIRRTKTIIRRIRTIMVQNK